MIMNIKMPEVPKVNQVEVAFIDKESDNLITKQYINNSLAGFKVGEVLLIPHYEEEFVITKVVKDLTNNRYKLYITESEKEI